MKRLRSSVVPFFRDGDDLKFILAVPRGKANRLGDFGGGVEDGEDYEECMMRELEEESYGLINVKKGGFKTTFDNSTFFISECEKININDLKNRVKESYIKNQGRGGDYWQTLSVEVLDADELIRLANGECIKNKYITYSLNKILSEDVINMFLSR